MSYQPQLDKSRWEVEGSKFQCRLTHPVTYYGKAVFNHRAGENMTFHLSPDNPHLKTGKASVVARNPRWKPGKGLRDLGLVTVKTGRQPVKTGSRMANRLLSELHQGKEIVVTRKPWYGGVESARLTMLPVNFRPAYQQYRECLSGLLPVNFDQVRRQAIYFASGKEELPLSERRKLDNITLYEAADLEVKAVYVDGHTDSKGPRRDNLELSKQRAEQVAAYLRERGIAADKIQIRWHGERYPVASNQGRKGRAKNRRVTVRLEKVPLVPPKVVEKMAEKPEQQESEVSEADNNTTDP